MKKRILALVFGLALICSLAACGGSSSSSSGSTGTGTVNVGAGQS